MDSIKHQLRYYDAMEDSHYKGLIDLAEVQSVTAGPAMPVGTKKVDEKAFFDVSWIWSLVQAKSDFNFRFLCS